MNADQQHKAMKRRDQQIADAWARYNDDDISTPRLLQMIIDNTGCEMDRVLKGLQREGVLKLVEPKT